MFNYVIHDMYVFYTSCTLDTINYIIMYYHITIRDMYYYLPTEFYHIRTT